MSAVWAVPRSDFPYACCQKIYYKLEWTCFNIIGVVFHMLRWKDLQWYKTELQYRTKRTGLSIISMIFQPGRAVAPNLCFIFFSLWCLFKIQLHQIMLPFCFFDSIAKDVAILEVSLDTHSIVIVIVESDVYKCTSAHLNPDCWSLILALAELYNAFLPTTRTINFLPHCFHWNLIWRGSLNDQFGQKEWLQQAKKGLAPVFWFKTSWA